MTALRVYDLNDHVLALDLRDLLRLWLLVHLKHAGWSRQSSRQSQGTNGSRLPVKEANDLRSWHNTMASFRALI